MSGTFNLIKDFMSALNASEQNKTQPYDTQGTVKRVEGDTAWVQFTGSDRETPVQMTIACDVGDTVQARIGGGSAWLTGNLTAPPTDDKKAVEAITMVNNVVQEVQETLEDVSAVDDVSMQYCLSDSSSTFTQYGDWSNTPPTYVSGKYYWTRSVLVDDDGNETYGEPRYSQDTQLSVETDVAFKSNNNHFWHDSSGAYVTTTNKSYSTGSAVRITASGILQQVNGSTVSSWTNSGISFYQGTDSWGNPLTVASFGSGGSNFYSASYPSTPMTEIGLNSFIVRNPATGYYCKIDQGAINFYYGTGGSVNGGYIDHTGGRMTIRGTAGIYMIGNANVSGGITANGHSSAIGTVKDAYLSSSKSVSSETGTALCDVSLEAGTWVVTCGVRFPANATGVRRANLTTTSGDTDIHIQLSASSSNAMQLAFTRIVSPTSTTTYYLNAWHNVSSSLTLPSGSSGAVNYIRAVRIA